MNKVWNLPDHPPELLAPAGGMEQLKAALRFGADAVYGGMAGYGLRAAATNFTPETLAQGTKLMHAQGKRFYVTMNLLPLDRDMPGFLLAARQAAEAGVDAAIVSDVGAALLLHTELPALPLHISTQANVLNSLTAKHIHEATGAERIVLSREMNIADIHTMRQALPQTVALEGFIHGAMCMAYSGRCLLSTALTGRSANRGACAQPCRWGYQLVEDTRPDEPMPIVQEERGTKILSAYDVCMLPHLPALLDAGLVSLKIEGRMKNAYYVATVVSTYRKALEVLYTQGQAAYEELVPALMAELDKTSHRASNTGFYFGEPQPAAGAVGFLQSMEYVGQVVCGAAAGETAEVELKNRFFVGDTLEVLAPEGSRPFTVTHITLCETGEAVQTASIAGIHLWMTFPFAVREGDIVRGPNRNHQKGQGQ